MREAHSLGIVHRDLKPANLFLCRTADGPLIKVLDFGISKITSEIDGRLTSPLQTMGSPVYMSPEQLRAKDVDARADIWSLGVTLFELLTGRPPHTGTTTAMIASILSDPSPRPSSLRREVPPGLDATVLKALAKNPADRYQDALELAEALSAFASPEGVKRLRATLAMPAAAPSGRRLFSLGTGDTPTADRSAPVAALRADKSAPTLAGARTDRSAHAGGARRSRAGGEGDGAELEHGAARVRGHPASPCRDGRRSRSPSRGRRGGRRPRVRWRT